VHSKKDSEEILRIAKERFKLAEEMWKPIYDEALDDLKFLSGDQWNEGDKKARASDNRPCLTVNRLPQYTRQTVNDQRQNKPAIKVSPVDDKADLETAKIFQGLIRHIEQSSKADRAYGRAFENAVENSFGFFRIRTDYVEPTSFDQEILIDQIPDPFLVKYDPFFKEIDGSDANWAFVESVYSKDDYCDEYGDSALEKEHDWKSLSDGPGYGWVTEKTARVCEYYCKEFKKTPIVKLSNGDVVEKEQFVEGVIGQDGQPIVIVSEKVANIPIIHHYKINALEILEETIFPGQYIPVIPVLGKEIVLNGKRIFESLIRHAKDPQRMLNYWVTCETETIALAPKAPFIAAEGQIPPEYKEMWRTANTKNHAVLYYKPTSLGGTPLPPPQRNVYEAPVQAVTNARMQSSEDLKATTGMYDAALGARSNENSGIAIQRRSAQTQTSNFHFVDNLSRSIRHCGRIIVDIVPQIYDTARTARIIGDEGDEDLIVINQIFEHKGEQKLFRLDVGKYDVSIDTGPSYATKRQEALASMIDLTKAYPQVAQVAGDLMVKNMDWPGAQEISERLKKALPPGLAEDQNQKPLPPEAQAQMQQMGQMIHALSEQLNQAKEAIKTKAIEIESKERIEFAKLENNLVIEQIKQQGQAALAAFREELSEISDRLRLLRMNEPIETDFNGSGQQTAVEPEVPQQPTGGFSPGPHMGEQPWQSQ
jgi:hypothetical protein